MRLRPSEIFYSQDSICSSFSNSEGIGILVNKICNGSESIHSIPTISVAKVGSKWYTTDNRRLWVFKTLEERGKCSYIDVKEIPSIPDDKMTTKNGGVSVKIRGNEYSNRPPRRRRYSDDSDYDCFGYDSDDNDLW
ncbi:hypothetical protein ACF0H5_010400 [Mactra antiquata]